MFIKEIISQHRRDLRAIYSCQHCGHEEEGSGYDDDNFHRNVVPNMKCKNCDQPAPEDYRPMGTKYAEGVVV